MACSSSSFLICVVLALVFFVTLPNYTEAVPNRDIPEWASSFDGTNYQRYYALNEEDYILYWSVNKKINEIKFAAVVRTVGWVGLGISTTGGMKGADIAVMRKSNNQLIIEDRFATKFDKPALDTDQNKVLITGESFQSTANNLTAFVFTRKIDSCDHDQDYDITPGRVWVIRAYGTDNTFQYHETRRGQVKINLLDPEEDPLAPYDSEEIIINMPLLNLTSSESTQYLCTWHKLPNDKKYHVVMYEPIVLSPLVHHMILYRCLGAQNITRDPESCTSMPGDCISFWVGWAVGGKTVFYPNEAGLPMGKGEGSAEYVMLQVHYDNKYQVVGEIDPGSGFRLVYTPTLRQHDIGTLTIGAVQFRIPANSDHYEALNECPSECTDEKVPQTGLTVIGNGFHMHRLGISTWTQHVRDGKELHPLGHLPYYDFNFQNPETSSLALNRMILPGDRLIQHCVWNSEGYNKSVGFGERTQDEMCFNFIQYYPRMDMQLCISLEPNQLGDLAVCAGDVNITSLSNKTELELAEIIAPYVKEFVRNVSYVPFSFNETCNADNRIPLCNDGMLSGLEDCEVGGVGCGLCSCNPGFQPASPKAFNCMKIDTSGILSPQAIIERNRLIIIYVVVGVLLALVMISITLVVRRNMRRAAIREFFSKQDTKQTVVMQEVVEKKSKKKSKEDSEESGGGKEVEADDDDDEEGSDEGGDKKSGDDDEESGEGGDEDDEEGSNEKSGSGEGSGDDEEGSGEGSGGGDDEEGSDKKSGSGEESDS